MKIFLFPFFQKFFSSQNLEKIIRKFFFENDTQKNKKIKIQKALGRIFENLDDSKPGPNRGPFIFREERVHNLNFKFKI